MKRRNRRIRYQEKAVFVLDANAHNRKNLKADGAFEYVNKMIVIKEHDIILKENQQNIVQIIKHLKW
jgi:hypothetical protein